MKFAFCTSIHPQWDLPAVTAKAKGLGYDGVDVVLPNAADGDPAAGSPLAERELVKLAFEGAGVQLAGVAADLRFASDRPADVATADAVRRVIDLAGRVRAGKVRVPAPAARPRANANDLTTAYADWLLPLADQAGGAGVTLLVQNAGAFRLAVDLWRLTERAAHPSLAIAWDPLAAAMAGESAAVAVPTLNSRIRQVMLRDAKVTTEDAGRQFGGYAPLGEGDLAPRKLLDRLRGVGYRGWVSVCYPADVDGYETALVAARATLENWKPVPPKVPAAAKAKAAVAAK